MKRFKSVIIILLLSTFLLGCAQEKEGTMEKAGKKIDQKIEKVQASAKELKEEVKDEIDDHTDDEG
ncbi:hypothetical protein [Acanthopleuribacter pedis]|uniref:Uncharacterized protein n=1 Tax=Acanthopleuribacter pedis TaxID=442870 RepID=A0A8J7U2B1_9BACT|nr:hypothetical protein [Acanthopleuribacter pedis]MBO1317519.1 hypothetical protein [Acanthopleuribacter pedis]